MQLMMTGPTEPDDPQRIPIVLVVAVDPVVAPAIRTLVRPQDQPALDGEPESNTGLIPVRVPLPRPNHLRGLPTRAPALEVEVGWSALRMRYLAFARGTRYLLKGDRLKNALHVYLPSPLKAAILGRCL
jgi:hypothetical protein